MPKTNASGVWKRAANRVPKRSTEYMAQRRKQILDALFACARRQGWERTTLDAVAAEAGLSKGAVYVHFESKRALLIGLLEEEIQAVETLAKIDSLEAFREHLKRNLGVLNQPDGWILATAVKEVQVAGAYDAEIRARLVVVTNRMIELFGTIIVRLNPSLTEAAARRRGLGLIMMMDGLNSSKSYYDSVTEADMHAVVDMQLDAITSA